MSSAEAPLTWSDAVWAAALSALDPIALGGVSLKGPTGPGRDTWLALLTDLRAPGTPIRRCPASIDTERLLGGLDLSASLAKGTSVLQQGLLRECDGGVVIFAMAECLPTAMGAQIASVLDQGEVVVARDGIVARVPTRFAVILLDEGQDSDERAPDALLERCAFTLATPRLPVALAAEDRPTRDQIAKAHALLPFVSPIEDEIVEGLAEAAHAFGIASLRPILAAVHASAAIAALYGRKAIILDDAALAARLVLAPIATRLPGPPPETSEEAEQDDTPPTQDSNEPPQASQNEPPPDPPDNPDQPNDPANTSTPPSDMLIETIKAALPDGIAAALLAARAGPRKARDRDGRGSGDAITSAKRGRPTGSRRGSLRSGQRLHLIDTLRAAAPWQKVRTVSGEAKRIHIRSEDIRIRRFVEKRETTIIFAVDASGSSAWQRLSEAKGAVQMMLAHAYQSRARVALVAFRKERGEIILPPTRSLTRARRLLADMVGGGGTPLASGLEVALNLALSERKKGRTPRLLLLTDGQANIARDGTPGRPQAGVDALAIAGQIAAFDIGAVHIDISVRPRPGANALAARMRAKYAPLPNPRSADLALLAHLSG